MDVPDTVFFLDLSTNGGLSVPRVSECVSEWLYSYGKTKVNQYKLGLACYLFFLFFKATKNLVRVIEWSSYLKWIPWECFWPWWLTPSTCTDWTVSTPNWWLAASCIGTRSFPEWHCPVQKYPYLNVHRHWRPKASKERWTEYIYVAQHLALLRLPISNNSISRYPENIWSSLMCLIYLSWSW